MYSRGTGELAVPLIDVVRYVTLARWWLVSGVVLGGLLGALAGILIAKKYRADTVLMVVTPTETRLGEQLGGLASLVGMDFGGSATKSEAVQTLRSQYLARKFIEQHALMPRLFPGDWDSQAQAWAAEDPADQPTLAQGVKRFQERVLRVSEDKAADTILVSVTWLDPVLAAEWTNELVALANQELRARAIRDAQRSIDYLTRELEKTDAVEVRELMYRLMDGHLRTMVVARTRAEYALRTIDPAVAPDAKSYVTPRRVLLILIGTVVGALLALLWHAVVQVRRTAATPRQVPS